VWHQFVVRVAGRERLREELHRRGVQTLVHYPVAPHQTGAYAGERHVLPRTERLADTVLSLPMSPHLDAASCARVCDALRSAIDDECAAPAGLA
jgi:dTDP-3-amino-3,4,6-trideoxy-alpha-D-glucose transaminase